MGGHAGEVPRLGVRMSRPLLTRFLRTFGERSTSTERRRFLQLSVGLGASLLVSGRAFAQSPSGGRLLIVGGGFSGLSCAFEARAAGLNPLVFEARDRVGGRVLSQTAEGQVHEAGAELIGLNHPRWLAYADRFGLSMRELGEEKGEAVIRIDGRALEPREVRRLWRDVVRTLRKLTRLARDVPGETPWLAPDAAALDARDVHSTLMELGKDPVATTFLSNLISADAAVPTTRQSLLATLATITGGGGKRYWTDSEVYRCAGGNQQLALALARELGPDVVRTGTPVAAIRWEPGAVQVELASGEVVQGDAVVCALPPTTWDRVRFEPELPPALRTTTGAAVKHLVRLSRPVWRDAGRKPDAYSDGLISMTWDGTDGQPGDPRWLVAFSGADQAAQGLALAAEDREARYLAEYEQLFPGFADAVVDRRYYDWPNDPLTGCGYSNAAVGEVTTTSRALHEGLFPLLFAGEHSSTAFAGYMEGALESGGRAAAKAAERLS